MFNFHKKYATTFSGVTQNYGFKIPERFFGPLKHACTLPLLYKQHVYLMVGPRGPPYTLSQNVIDFFFYWSAYVAT